MKAIEHYINELPSCDVSIEDFPYLESYFEYILEQSTKGFRLPDYHAPKLIIKDTPYSESHLIEYDDGSIVIFDISTSLLLTKINGALLNGYISKDAWLSMLGAGANMLLSLGEPQVGLSFALNRAWDLKRSMRKRSKTQEKPLIILASMFDEDYGGYGGNVRCQEMFILAHELTHYFVSQNLYVLNKVPRYIFSEFVKGRGVDLSTGLFFKKVLGIIKPSDFAERSHYRSFRKIFFSRQFAEETLCDIKAAEIALEYFTWDGAHLSHAEVCTSIQSAMRSFVLASSLKSHIRSSIDEKYNSSDLKENIAIHLFLRTKVLDAFLSKTLKSSLAARGMSTSRQLDEVIEYDVIHFENIRKRAAAIETCLFDEVINRLDELNQAYVHIDKHIADPEKAALYYLGYNSPATDSHEFLACDGSVFIRNQGLHAELEKVASVELSKISSRAKRNASKIMDSTIC